MAKSTPNTVVSFNSVMWNRKDGTRVKANRPIVIHKKCFHKTRVAIMDAGKTGVYMGRATETKKRTCELCKKAKAKAKA